MTPIGHKRWTIAEGYIPGWSHGPEPQMTSHETACILNAGDRDAQVRIFVFFSDRDPAGPYEFTVPARRTKHVRFNELKDPEPDPQGHRLCQRNRIERADCGTAFASGFPAGGECPDQHHRLPGPGLTRSNSHWLNVSVNILNTKNPNGANSWKRHLRFPPTTTRVEEHTADEVNERIRRETDERVAVYLAASRHAIDERLEQLDHEWDMERTLEANAATLAFTGVILGATVSRKFLALPALVTGFLLQHAIQGWCPPVPFFRRRGFRTAREIEEERMALKALRGRL